MSVMVFGTIKASAPKLVDVGRITTEGRLSEGFKASSVVMQTASHWAAPYIVRQGSYSASLRTMSTFHFSSMGPCRAEAPSISFSECATPKTLQDGYSLQASENDGAAASALVVATLVSATAVAIFRMQVFMFSLFNLFRVITRLL